MELQMTTDIAKVIPNAIEFNYEEIKGELAQKLDKYNNLVVTKDAIKEAKKDKAALNKLAEVLNGERISREREYMAPFNVFKGQVQELVGMIKEPVGAIDNQIKVFEDEEIKAKKIEIENFYNINIKELKDILPLEKIIPEKWQNKTKKLIDITQEIMETIERVRNDLQIIEAMNLDYEDQMKDAYLKDLNMSDALAEKHRFEEQRKRLAEAKKKKAEPQPAEAQSEATPTNDLSEPATKPESNIAVKTLRVIFYNTTPEFRADMKALTDKHNIKYGGIK